LNIVGFLQRQSELISTISMAGFCFIPGQHLQAYLLSQSDNALEDWQQFAASWNDMPLDEYMADGGRYRRRRYATLSAESGESLIKLEPHQPHYQSTEYNRLNGGVARIFAPILPEVMAGATMQSILKFSRNIFSSLSPAANWHIECHQFRIEANQGEPGKPTPEGVHRDGVDYVLVMMVHRENISSGTTTMHDEAENTLDSFTLTHPFDAAIVDDRRRMHGVTPILPIDPNKPAYRDVLVLTFRKK
jgi:hypothetical protein